MLCRMFMFSTDVKFRSPKQFGKGKKGDDKWFEIELKLIAHVGLVGFPNAGKSSFLTAISNARPKVAHYPFTTLSPQLGTVQYPDFFSYTVADLPGSVPFCF